MNAALPFDPAHALSKEQHQVLALAAVFQAAQIVHVIATTGTSSLGELGQHYTQILLQSTLNIRAEHNPNQNSLLFFQSLKNLSLGLRSLEQSLIAPYDPQPKNRYPRLKVKNAKQTLSYALSLLSLSRKVYRDKAYCEKISKAQQNIIRQLAFFNYDYQHPSIIAALAQVYTETASNLKPRIMVKGSEQAFKNPHEVAHIRAILFSGLQAAHYWRDLGGSPWKMLFTKDKILKQIQYFAELQHRYYQVETDSKL